MSLTFYKGEKSRLIFIEETSNLLTQVKNLYNIIEYKDNFHTRYTNSTRLDLTSDTKWVLLIREN